jgi:hypothetical protein
MRRCSISRVSACSATPRADPGGPGSAHGDPAGSIGRTEVDGLADAGVVRDATVDQVTTAVLDRREDAGNGGAREHAGHHRPGGDQHLASAEQVRGDEVHGDLCLHQVLDAGARGHEVAQAGVAGDGGAQTEQAPHHLPWAQGKDVGAPEPRPDGGELGERAGGHAVPGHPGGVHRSGGGADEEVGSDVVRGEGLEHADLDGPEAAAAGEHERGRHGNTSTISRGLCATGPPRDRPRPSPDRWVDGS